MQKVYFDYNATSPMIPEARNAWMHAQEEHWQNESGLYSSAARVHNKLEEARDGVSSLLGGGRIVFNSGATESHNSLMAWLSAWYPSEGNIIISAIEHASVLEPARYYFGERVIPVYPDANGVVSVEAVREVMQASSPILVSLMAANNETGVIQPWEEVAELCRSAGVSYHCDASQWLGKMPTSSIGVKCDYVTATAHKFGGPKAAGFIKLPEYANGFTSLQGGRQEDGARAGTVNYPAISAMETALRVTSSKAPASTARDTFEKIFLEKLPKARIVGIDAQRLWNTSLLLLPSHENSRWVTLLDKAGFEVSTGSACSAGDEDSSHVLVAMGIDADEAKRAVRISGWDGIPSRDWRALAEALEKIEKELDAEGPSQVIDV